MQGQIEQVAKSLHTASHEMSNFERTDGRSIAMREIKKAAFVAHGGKGARATKISADPLKNKQPTNLQKYV